jgi:hypothetical protein
LTDAQCRALAIADNRLALNAGWDDDLLRIEIAALREDTVEGLTDEDAVPEVPESPTSALGDLITSITKATRRTSSRSKATA